MLAQILQEMWVDPEVLEALSEDQRRILFLKMRQEQVRRWTEREEKDEREGRTREHTRSKKGLSKTVRWQLGRDGDVSVSIIGEVDEFRSSKLLQNIHTNSRLQNRDLNNLVDDIHKVSLLTDSDNHQPRSQPSMRMQLSNDSDGSKESEEEPDSGSAEDEPRVPAEDSSDSESGNSTDKDWVLHYSPHRHSNSSNLPQSQPQLSVMERANPRGRGVAVHHEEANPGLGGRVAQLRRAFATSSCVSKPPMPTKPSHLQLVPKPSIR
ncbi:SH2 domain-containing protein 4A [Esox lucius]|uniref:SH2 domain-containing protein n=1 Tax=Esox lucius TaxID=8010 RepID=A0A3P8ZR92_ESOLU|nr:SH2 domain-containing protein 4A [Esox lucius]XP_034147513.1 SH2 domain-containing protein 4A [Esox lucius]